MKKSKNQLVIVGMILGCWLLLPMAGRLKGTGNQKIEHEAHVVFETLDKQLPIASPVYYNDKAGRYGWITYIRLELVPRVFYLDTAMHADTVLVALSDEVDTNLLLQHRSILWSGTVTDIDFWLLAKKKI